jgi:CRP-like cAMP-binding protein
MDALLYSSDLSVRQRSVLPADVSPCDRLFQKLAKASGINIDGLRPLLRNELAYVCPQGKLLARAGDDAAGPKILLSGWACYQRILECGRRQIFSFVLPGDLLGNWSGRRRLQADIVAITPLLVLKASEFSWAVAQQGRYAALADLLSEMEMRQNDYLYQQIQRLGSQTAVERVCDLLHELFVRLRDAEQNSEPDLSFPLTQETLADALGMTSVHINRVLQQMQREGLLSLGRGRLTVYPRQNDLLRKKRTNLTTIKEHAPRA